MCFHSFISHLFISLPLFFLFFLLSAFRLKEHPPDLPAGVQHHRERRRNPDQEVLCGPAGGPAEEPKDRRLPQQVSQTHLKQTV